MTDAVKTYSHIADIKFEGNSLVIINKFTGAYHPFANGDTKIMMNAKQKIQVLEWLNNSTKSKRSY